MANAEVYGWVNMTFTLPGHMNWDAVVVELDEFIGKRYVEGLTSWHLAQRTPVGKNGLVQRADVVINFVIPVTDYEEDVDMESVVGKRIDYMENLLCTVSGDHGVEQVVIIEEVPTMRTEDEMLRDYALWAGTLMVEGEFNHASPWEYIQEVVEENNIDRRVVDIFLRSFYSEETVVSFLEQL